MSTFSRDDVLQLARLARVDVTEEETALFAVQLRDILDFIREVQAVDTSTADTAPAVYAGDYRDDTVQPSLERDDALAAAPDADSGLFKVPRVLNG